MVHFFSFLLPRRSAFLIVGVVLGPSLLPYPAVSISGAVNFVAAKDPEDNHTMENTVVPSSKSTFQKLTHAIRIAKQTKKTASAEITVRLDPTEAESESFSTSNEMDFSSTFDQNAFLASDELGDLGPDGLVEGCENPATISSVSVKNNKPVLGHVGAFAVDGDASTRWSVKGKKKWMDIEFKSGKKSDFLAEGVAIAFFRGSRRVAFFDITLYNKDGDVVATLHNMESGGRTEDFETFKFDEHVEGSKIRINVRGTTAGLWNGITEVAICLVPLSTPAPVPIPTLTPSATSGVTYVGCFMDDNTGKTRSLSDAHTQDNKLTPLSCAAFCSGYKYMGLQFSTECFCGNAYYSSDRTAIPADTCFMPCSGDEEENCGGPWTNSIYTVGHPPEETAEEIEAGKTSWIDDNIPRRKFTIHNNCGEQVRLGATGGFVKAFGEEDVMCPDGSVLDERVRACFWGLPLPEDGKTYDMKHGESLEVILDNQAMNGVRWSGNLWASTGCEKKVGCETASCLRNPGYPDGYCPPSTGPTGPVSKAEFTLVDTGVDYYDITMIDGVNLPVEMKPDPDSSPLERADDYWCSNAGGTKTMSANLEGCTWHFDASDIHGFPDDDMTRYLRWVRNDGGFEDCETDEDCVGVEGEGVGENLKCGSLFGQNTLNGGVTEELFPNKCGSPIGWHSANGVCGSSQAKPLGYFPNSYPFMCNVKTGQVRGDNSTQAHLYGCAGHYYGQSGYSKHADETACGCPAWKDEGINAPSSSQCESKNPYWSHLSLPWLKYLKAACPTAYCFPFDDHSSTFVCRNEDGRNTHGGLNSVSYIITFCPDDSLSKMLS